VNIQEIDNDIDFLCGSTSGTYAPTNKRRNMNIAYHDVARIIWESDGGWHYDDSNAATLPRATTSLVHNQSDYTLPTTALGVRRVEVLDGGGNPIKLRPLDPAEVTVGIDEVLGSGGTPRAYELMGNSVILYPTPLSSAVTVTDGLTIWVDRKVTEIAVSATTTEPGFATPFHRVLSYACALDFSQDPQQRQFFAMQKERLEQAMRTFYAKRAPEVKSVIKPGARKKWIKYT